MILSRISLPIAVLCLSIFSSVVFSWTENTKKLPLVFSKYDIAIEDIANQYYSDGEAAIRELNKLAEKMSQHNFTDKSYLLAYRCYLEASSEQAEALNSTRSQLRQMILLSKRMPSVLAANTLCDANIAIIEKRTDDYRSHMEMAYQYSRNSRSVVMRYWISIGFASVATNTSRHHDALEAAEYGLEIALANNDKAREAASRSAMALSEAELFLFDSALNNNQLAIDWNQQMDYQFAVLYLLQNRGYIQIGINQLPEAKDSFQKAIVLAKQNNYEPMVVSLKTNLAAIALKEKLYKRAEELCRQIYAYLVDNPDDELKAHADSIMAIAYAYQLRHEEAEQAYRLGNEYFQKQEMFDALSDNYSGWAEAMAELGLYEQAYKTQIQFQNIQNRIFQNQRDAKLAHLKATFRSVEKDREIEQLSLLSSQQKKELENNRLKTQNWWLSALTLLLLSLLLMLMYKRARAKVLQLSRENKKLDKERYCDPLTGSYNRRYLNEKLTKIIQCWVKKELNSVAFFLLDIDHFKLINDTHGHAAGDNVLMEFVARLKDSLRDQDHIVRIGGEEFLVAVLSSEKDKSKVIAGKLLKVISSRPIKFDENSISITTSIGFVQFEHLNKSGYPIDSFIEIADQALYRAKGSGRNKAIYAKILEKDLSHLTINKAIDQGKITWQSLEFK